jgi:hypothetical protein
MKKILIVLIVLAGLIGVWFGLKLITEEEPVACTTDAKQCPDGSYVGRIPPECDFAPCPGETEWSAIKQAITNREAESVWQTHDRRVGAKLKNGEELVGVEPELDDIINIAESAEPKCGEILMATE